MAKDGYDKFYLIRPAVFQRVQTQVDRFNSALSFDHPEYELYNHAGTEWVHPVTEVRYFHPHMLSRIIDPEPAPGSNDEWWVAIDEIKHVQRRAVCDLLPLLWRDDFPTPTEIKPIPSGEYVPIKQVKRYTKPETNIVTNDPF